MASPTVRSPHRRQPFARDPVGGRRSRGKSSGRGRSAPTPVGPASVGAIRVRPAVPAWVLALAVAALGCTSAVDPAPFQTFADGARALRDGVDQRAAADVEDGRRRFLDAARRGAVSPADLRLEFPSAFEAQLAVVEGGGEPPLFLRLEGLRAGLRSLNDGWVEYADLLTLLAGGELVPADDIERLATELNASTRQAAGALGLGVEAGEVALFSAAATAAFQAVLDGQRRRALADAVEATQPAVERLARQVRQALEIIALGVQRSYLEDYRRLALEASRAGAAAADDDSALAATRAILELNAATRTTLGLLAELSAGYDRLPAAHAQLALAAAGRPGAVGAVRDFAQRAVRLRATAERLEAAAGP